jgi:hypothetical protein
LRVRVDANLVVLPGATIDLHLGADVSFSAIDTGSGETVTGRAGGGSSVTIYDRDDYYQYAVVSENGL